MNKYLVERVHRFHLTIFGNVIRKPRIISTAYATT